jgi:hypothetical protein
MIKVKKILLTLVFGLVILGACYGSGRYEQEMIVVNITPRGVFSGEESPEGFPKGWHEIGLSRNGKEPVEYIWFATEDPYSAAIMNAEVGEKGIVYSNSWSRRDKRKLPRPNANNPPIIGSWGEASWKKQRN